MIHRNFDLFYEIYNTINEHNRSQTYYLSLILEITLTSIKDDSKNFSTTSSALPLTIISFFSLYQSITWSSSSSLSLEEIKLIVIVN